MKKTKLLALAVLMGAVFAVGGFGGKALAATKTWIGTDCPATDCNWSNVNNWQGGVIPVNGDDIVINASSSTPASAITTNDIASLTVSSITLSGYQQTSIQPAVFIIHSPSGGPSSLTVTGNVTYTAPTTAGPSGWLPAQYALIDANITLGADSVLTNTAVNDTNTVTLGGHALTIKLLGTYSGSTTYPWESLISGNGTVNIDLPTNIAIFLNNSNSYTGTTNVNSVNYTTTTGGGYGYFGASTVNLGSAARLLFLANGTATISNVINVTPPTVTGTFLNNQLEFWSSTAPVTYTIPNIRLLGNARFGVNSSSGTVTVNLAGIVSNGHCVQYGTDNNSADSFQNGPAACVVAVTTQAVPKAPDTGAALLTAHPIMTAVVTFTSVAGLIIAARYAARARGSQ